MKMPTLTFLASALALFILQSAFASSCRPYEGKSWLCTLGPGDTLGIWKEGGIPGSIEVWESKDLDGLCKETGPRLGMKHIQTLGTPLDFLQKVPDDACRDIYIKDCFRFFQTSCVDLVKPWVNTLPTNLIVK
jgi:hypothetical protein